MNNFGGFNPGGFPPQNPNDAIRRKRGEDYPKLLALQKKQQEEQARNQPPAVVEYQKPPEVFAPSEAPPVRKGHPVMAVLMFLVMCFITFVAGGIAFGATRKLAFAVPVWIAGVLLSALFAGKVGRGD